MELQEGLGAFARANIAVFAISYDAVSVLSAFAEQRGITFPLLSDEGSVVIEHLGLLNEHVAEQQAFYGRSVEDRHRGIPYPGIFRLDENGVIVARQFEQSYRVRPAADVLLEDLVPLESLSTAVSASAEADGVRFTAWLADNTYRPYELLHLHLSLRIPPGVHVYSTPAPPGLTGLSVEIEPIQNLVIEPLRAPAGTAIRVEGQPETALAYEGDTTISVPFHIDANEGDQGLVAIVHYQACTDQLCYPPARIRLELPLVALDSIRP